MATRRVKKHKRKLSKPRDPFWRLRRMLGEKRAKSRKAYDRAKSKLDERNAAGHAAKEED
ncbi:MAG TPA: hypothetical protein VM325_00750 [Alphaproteobacteria bacterium]|nr:hypothetical protein [Alphaproteobacteria bacterium]